MTNVRNSESSGTQTQGGACKQAPGDILTTWGLGKHFERERPLSRRVRDWLDGTSPERITALEGVGFTLKEQETLGVLGESGSGKSTLARILTGLIHPDAGGGILQGLDLFSPTPAIRLLNRQRLQMIFQDPFGSLDPRFSIHDILAEPLRIHGRYRKAESLEKLRHGLEEVGLEPDALPRYPAEFSGGQRQRIGICRALLLEPAVVIADEAVSALDVSVQAQILDLLVRLKAGRRLSVLFISHDVAVVRQLADRVIVLYKGRLVEELAADCLMQDAAHPYTRRLLGAALQLREGIAPSGDGVSPVPENVQVGSGAGDKGCFFAPECPARVGECHESEPPWRELHPGHRVSCRVLAGIPD